MRGHPTGDRRTRTRSVRRRRTQPARKPARGCRPALLPSARHPRDRRGRPALACGQRAREDPCRPAPSSVPTSACSPSRARAPSPSPAGSAGCPLPMRRASAPSCSWPGETGSYGLAGAVSGTLRAGLLASPARSGPGRWTGAARAPVLRLVHGRASCVIGRRLRRRRRRRRAALDLVRSSPRSTGACGARTSARWCGPGGRTRWTPAQRQTAFAFESVVDEVVFVVGPPLVTLLATLIAPPVGFLTGLRRRRRSAACGWPRQRSTEPPVHRARGRARRAAVGRARADRARRGASRTWPSARVFGAMDVVVVGVRRGARARRRWPGVALAAYAGGSLVAGLVYGLARLPGTLRGPLRRPARLLFGAGRAAAARRSARCAVLVPARASSPA